MFVFEESQLLEDTIKDPSVLGLYKILRENESSNDRLPIVNILKNQKCLALTDSLVKFYQSNGSNINEPAAQGFRFRPGQKSEILKELGLDVKDLAPLTLVVAATLTQLFVIDNITGPSDAETVAESYQNLPDSLVSLKSVISYRSLSKDGSEVYHLIVNPWLLKLAQLLWTFLDGAGFSKRLLELEFLVWKHRYLTTYLSIFLEPAESIISDLRKIQEYIFDHHVINEIRGNKTQLERFNIVELCSELVQSALLRDGITFSRKVFEYACDYSGISIEHTGVLGKRTRFQQTNVAQLVIKIARDEQKKQVETFPSSEDKLGLPEDIKLDDDTLLPDISFVTEDENGVSVDFENNPSVEAQILMMTNLDMILNSEVMEQSLKDEWVLAYLRSITRAANIWAVKYKALSIRSVVEKKHLRKMDRALLQLEDLIKKCDCGSERTSRRMRSIYSVLPSSSWQMKRSLGDISFDLGLFKNALDSYSKIEYWEGMIKCLAALNETHKAENVIRQELAKNETPFLYCLLGDATEDINYYEKSWTLSKGRFARAKKSIGTHYYVRKQYEEAIENYELALKVNPSNISILSLLAYSCLTLERYDRAAECYRNLTYCDDSNFLAWNNLSKAYIKLGQKERAWRTLREALKCDYEQWKVWDNFMVVSMDIGVLEDVILAWNRILDIKSSHKDDQMLRALTYALTQKPSNEADAEYLNLLNDALQLVARLVATSDCSPRLWTCYFKLLIKEFKTKTEVDGKSMSKLDVDTRVSKITNALQRATPTALIADSDWFQVPEKVDNVLDNYDELVDCYRMAIEVVGPRIEIWKQWKSLRMSINSAMNTIIKKGYLSLSTCASKT